MNIQHIITLGQLKQSGYISKSVHEEVKPDILPKSGAGQDGTDELVNTYKNDTPGQGLKKFKDFRK